jgi:hypothetical protein
LSLVIVQSTVLISINRNLLKKVFPISPLILDTSFSFFEQKGIAKKEIVPLGSCHWGLIPYEIEAVRLFNPVFVPSESEAEKKQFFQVKLIQPDEWMVPLKGIDYFNLVHGVGTLGWNSASMTIEEHACPKYLVDTEGGLIPNPDYRGEVYFLDPVNKAEFICFTPNLIEIAVDVTSPDRLIINQNYDRYWNTDSGLLGSYKGLLSLDLQKRGSYIIKMHYFHKGVFSGLLISVLTILCLAGYLISKNLSKKPD